MRNFSKFFTFLSFIFWLPQAFATMVTVTDLSGGPTIDDWGVTSAQQGGATSSIVSLNGLGGNLENNAPLPNGALLLTTGLDNNDRAEVGLIGDFGTVGSILNSTFSLSYDYYRENLPGGNTFAAPSVKLAFFNGSCPPTEDCFFQLIYEPYLNSGGVVDGDWASESIDFTTGGFWNTGGFGLANQGGGCVPSCFTLEGVNLGTNSFFQSASLVGVSIGMGTFNQGVNGYVDNVSLQIGNRDFTYDFEVAAAVDEPLSVLLVLLALIGVFTRKTLRSA